MSNAGESCPEQGGRHDFGYENHTDVLKSHPRRAGTLHACKDGKVKHQAGVWWWCAPSAGFALDAQPPAVRCDSTVTSLHLACPLGPPCAVTLPSKCCISSRQHRAWPCSAAPSSTNPAWCPTPSPAAPRMCFQPFPWDLPASLQPLPGASHSISSKECPHAPCFSITPSHAPAAWPSARALSNVQSPCTSFPG